MANVKQFLGGTSERLFDVISFPILTLEPYFLSITPEIWKLNLVNFLITRRVLNVHTLLFGRHNLTNSAKSSEIFKEETTYLYE